MGYVFDFYSWIRKRKVSCTVSRNGDLIHKVYLQVDLPSVTATTAGTVGWVDKVGHALIDEVSLEIGGQTIKAFWVSVVKSKY